MPVVRLPGDENREAFVDVERRSDGIHVLAATGITEIILKKDALGAKPEEPIKIDVPNPHPPTVRWAP